MYSFRKIFLVTIGVIFFAVFALGGPPLSAQQSSSSQLLTVAVLPFESYSYKDPEKYRFVGWGLHYLISSRLQNLPGIYCLSAEEVVNIYPQAIEEESKIGVLETIQENLKFEEEIRKIHLTLGVDILIYGYYDHHEEIFKLYAERDGYKPKLDEVDFSRSDLENENVFSALMDRIIKLIQSVIGVQNSEFDQFCKTLNKESPIFELLPDYQANGLFEKCKDEYIQFYVYSETWKDYVTAIRKQNKCDTMERNWTDYAKSILKKNNCGSQKIPNFTRRVDGLVLDAYIQLHNKKLDIRTQSEDIRKFQSALDKTDLIANQGNQLDTRTQSEDIFEFQSALDKLKKSNLVSAQLGQIKTLWEMGKPGYVRTLLKKIQKNTRPESGNPWFDIYQIALEANEQWDKSNLGAMENIAKRVPWLKTGFDKNSDWAAAMLAKFFLDRGKITDLGKVFNEIDAEKRQLNSIVLSFLIAEMYMRKGEYIVAYRHYNGARNLLQGQKKRHLTYFNPKLFERHFLENKVKQCQHVLYKKRLPGGGTFRKFYQKYASDGQLVEDITALAQDPKFRPIYAGTDELNIYRLLGQNDRFEEAIIESKDFLDRYINEGGVRRLVKKGNKIVSLQFDKSGNLWTATTKSGLFQWDGQTLVKCYIRSCESQQNKNKNDLQRIIEFLIDNENNFWIAPLGGAIKRCNFDKQNNCLDCETIDINSDRYRYTSLLKDNSDNIFTTTDDAVYCYDESQHEFVELFNKKDFDGQSIIKAAIYPNGIDDQNTKQYPNQNTKLWIITGNIGEPSYNQYLSTAYRIGEQKKRPALQNSLKPASRLALEGFSIEKILPVPRGGLWIGTQKQGLLNVKDNTTFDYNDFLFDGEDVFDLLWDKGLLWIASPKGVRRFNFDTLMTYVNKDGLPGDVVYAVAGSKSGEVYIGTSDGLAVYRNGLIKELAIPNMHEAATPRIFGLMYNSKTGLWCRGKNWLYHYPPNSDGIHEGKGHPHPDNLEDGFTDQKNEIQLEIVADNSREGVWINTFQGLCFVPFKEPEANKKSKIKIKYINLPPPGFRPTAPAIDRDENIWFARKDVIYHIDKVDIKRLLKGESDNKDIIQSILDRGITIDKKVIKSAFRNHPFHNLYVNLIRLRTSGNSHSVWLGTSVGVIEYQPSTNEFKLQNKKLGLGDIPVMVTALEFEDYPKNDSKSDSLWIGSNHGLLQYNFRYGQSSRYNHQYGLQNTYVHSIGRFEKERIWVGTDQGLASFRLRNVAPLISVSNTRITGVGEVISELTPVFFREAHKDLRYLVLNEKTGDMFWVSPSHYPSSKNTKKKPEFSLSSNRLSIKRLSPGDYHFSIRALSREFQLTPKEVPIKFSIPYPIYVQPWFFAVIGLMVLFLSVAFYLNTQHARRRFGPRWAAITYSRRMRKSQDTFILIIYTIFQKNDAPEKILEYIRTQTAAGKDNNLAGLIQNYLYLFKLPNTLHILSRLLKKAQHMRWSQDVGNLYHIISEMLKKEGMDDIAGLQLKFDANQYRLDSSVCGGVDIPEFISIDIVKQLILLDKTLSILAQIASESDYKHQWYYLTAADKILRDILAGSFQAANCPEKNVIISIANKYSSIVQKEMNRVIAIESKMREDITGRQIIRHLVENEYPAPIAYLYTRAQREDNPVIKADYELDLLGVLIRMLTYIVITDYVSIPQMEERIDLSSLAIKPFSDGEWNGIFRNIVTTLDATRQNHSIPEIYEEFSQKRSIQQLSDLIALRNNIVHRRRRDIQTISAFNESLTRLLEKIHFFKDLDLLIVRKVLTDEGPFKYIKFLKAKGDILNLSTIKVTTGISLSEHHAVVHNPLQSRIIDLYPFLRFDYCTLCKDHHIFYFSDVSGNRARYLSASTDCINQSKAFQHELAEYLDPTSEVKAWIEYHLFKEEKELNRD